MISKLLVLSILSTASAFAEQPLHLSDLATHLVSQDLSYTNGFLAGVVMMNLGSADVCGGHTVVGAAEAQLSADIRNYLEKNPSKDVAIELTDAPIITLELLKNDYPCLK